MTHGYRMRLIAVPLLVVAALSGCAAEKREQQVASAGGKPSAGASAPADNAALGRKFAQCMRTAGVDMPDPGPDGMVAMPATAADDQAAMKKMDAAMEKCREFLPDGGEPPKATAEDLAKARDYAKCVRENGVPGFPDPDPETGRFQVDPDKTGELEKLSKVSGECQQFGAGAMPGIEVGR
jgi:hypothetical protein